MTRPRRRSAGAGSQPADPIRRLVRSLLTELGEAPSREGLARTPDRVAASLRFLTGGYGLDLHAVVNGAVFEESCNEMILVRDIELYSLCEHHLLPFFGKCHVGYIPKSRVLGISKIPRIVDMFARRLQVQERLTKQIADAITEVIEPRGVGVIVEARHLCMMMRGVEKQNSMLATSAMTGLLREDPKTRSEFLHLVHSGCQ